MQNCGKVMRYAIATSRAERNPVADLRDALTPAPVRHFAAITNVDSIGGLLRAIDGYGGGFVSRCALQFAPMVFVRPGELRMAEWCEFDLDAAEWNIPAERMKMRQPHLVPLSRQAVEVLRDLQRLTGSRRYLFPSVRDPKRPMSNNTINAALRRLGYDSDTMTGHGFRAMARTVLDEVLGYRPDYIEHQLAHAVRDPNGRAYNRTAHLAERRKMMQGWADFLDSCKADSSVVVAIRGRA
jgi:integrase